MSRITAPYRPQSQADSPPASGANYLNAAYGAKSWLLTTDHKRIALLYLISVTGMFLIGGLAATLIRLHLLTPSGALMTADTYNKVFTAHGVIMVFFFLVPVVPAVLGNFCLPLMIGAQPGIPAIELGELVHLYNGCRNDPLGDL